MTFITRSLFVCLLISHVYGLDDSATEVVVLNTLEMNEIGWKEWPDATQNGGVTWQEASWLEPNTRKSHTGYHVCSVGEETVDNWLRTSFVTFEEEVQTVHVNVSFFMRECQEYPDRYYQCRTQFQVLKYDTNHDFATATTPSWDESAWTSVKTVPADHTYVNMNDDDVKSNNYTFTFDKTLSGFYLAFRETGMCAFLLSVKIWYRRCPAQIIRHTELNSTPANNNLVTVYGQCVDNAEPIDQAEGKGLQFLCTSLGEWFNPSNSIGCACKPGYKALENGCQACDAGQYKSELENTQCHNCPLNSQSFQAATSICACNSGFYRAPGESASIMCTKPPSEVRDLTVSYISDDSVTLTWLEPLEHGERNDISYRVECSSCSIVVTQGFNSTSVTLANLVPNTEYTVTVYSVNGVSRQAPSSVGKSAVFQTRQSNAPLNPIDMLKASANSLELTWPAVPQADFYRVEWYERQDAETKKEIRVQTNRVVLDNLESSTTYAIKVKSFDINEAIIGQTEEAIYTTEKSEDLVLMISVAIVAVVVCMAIVIVIVVMFLRRSKQQCAGEKNSSECEGLGPYTNVPFHITNSTQSTTMNMPLFGGTTTRVKTYVDPHTYEDPRQAVKEFTKEINVSSITIEAVIGGGEFGDVCRGKMKPVNKAEIRVAIKTLKPGASEKSRIDFLTEASIMGQFDDPNVISLEGVITKSNPIMIVTEYMENGSLDTFLRANDGKLSQVKLLGMLHGIASGMTYLSEMSYIHRDLAARNILVNSSLVCKVADFGLSREVEYDTSEGAYTTRGGKIPVRWTAPEAISYRKFTTASDTWSFGVVMWEMMSFGERPYWNWSNQDVIKAVGRGYRLPPPMECPDAVYQLMLDCWQKDRKNRPRFAAIRLTIDRLVQSPDLLRQLAKPVLHPSLLDPEMGDISSQMTVSEWLQLIKMDRYTESFALKGIHTMEQVAWLTFADLLEMGVTLVGHQKKIMSSVQSLKPQFDGTASPLHVSEGFLV